MKKITQEAQEVLDFWFIELTPQQWYVSAKTLDNKIIDRFKGIHKSVAAGETDLWRATPKGRLAEIIVLDQFSRNMFRGTAEAFAYDTQAVCLTQEAIEKDCDKDLTANERQFLYMPLMHSESKKIHMLALEKYTELGNEASLEYEKLHKRIIDRFGRYPHRNEILGRETTPEEQEFLDNDKNAKF